MRMVVAICWLAWVGCRAPHDPSSTGSVVFEVTPSPDATFFATQAELMRSPTLLERDHERLEATSVTVARRGAAAILDVVVTAKDPRAAAASCNRILEAFVERRLMVREADRVERLVAIEQQLDGLHGDPTRADALIRERAALETERDAHINDVHLLLPCKISLPAH